jgi:hypothetical protein
MERILSELVDKLRSAHGDNHLVSVVLYGSAAVDHKDRFSDFNVLCVLKQVTPAELRRSEPVFRWWREMRNPAPLLLSETELHTSTDAFPIEFHDIKEGHRILYGTDVVANMEIDDSFYRAQVEYELRAKMIRLRQKAGGLLSQHDLLLRLMADSVSTFCVLFRHVLRLSGEQPAFEKRAVIDAAASRFGLEAAPFHSLLDVREEKVKPRSLVSNAENLFGAYLDGIGVVLNAVDRIAK